MATRDLAEAVKSRVVGRVRALIENDPTLIDKRDEQGNSPVLTAAYYGA